MCAPIQSLSDLVHNLILEAKWRAPENDDISIILDAAKTIQKNIKTKSKCKCFNCTNIKHPCDCFDNIKGYCNHAPCTKHFYDYINS